MYQPKKSIQELNIGSIVMMPEVGRPMPILLRQPLQRLHLVPRGINMFILEQKMWLEISLVLVVVEFKLIRRPQPYVLRPPLDLIIATLESMSMQHALIIEEEVVLKLYLEMEPMWVPLQQGL